jgi:hypothetical protein
VRTPIFSGLWGLNYTHYCLSFNNETNRSPISTDERNLDFMGVATQTKRYK